MIVDETISNNNNNTQRSGNRSNTDIQNILIKPNINSNTQSSIYIETNELKLLAYIEGPIYQTNLETSSKMKITVNINLPTYQTNNVENKLASENLITKILSQVVLTEKYNKSMLKISFDILEYKCDYTHYCLMAASLAISNMQIEQKGLITCSNVIIDKNNNIIVDPNLNEEKDKKLKLMFSCLLDLQENIIFKQEGDIDNNSDLFKEIVGISIGCCKQYQDFIINYLE